MFLTFAKLIDPPWRRVSLGGVLVVLLSPIGAGAIAPDGLDCDQYPEIPAERCAAWKERNASGKWWCTWDASTGAVATMYGARESQLTLLAPLTLSLSVSATSADSSPAFDFTSLTPESLQLASVRRELEEYACWHVRRNAEVLGIDARCGSNRQDQSDRVDGDGNNGHGNDVDGHDESNPGHGHGGPNGDGDGDDDPGISRGGKSQLKFADVRREPGESFDQFDVVGNDVVASTSTSVPVYHIALNQILGRTPVEGATVVVTVSEANEFLGIRSNFRPEPVGGSVNPRTSDAQAVSRALAFTSLTTQELDDVPGALPAWVENEGELLRAWRVALSPASGAGLIVTILDDGQAVLEVEELGASACPIITELVGDDPFQPCTIVCREQDGPFYPTVILPDLSLAQCRAAAVERAAFLSNQTGQTVVCEGTLPGDTGTGTITVATPSGFRDGIGHAYPSSPPLPVPGTDVFGFLDLVDEVILPEMCTWDGPKAVEHNGRLIGRYVRVSQKEGEAHQNLGYDLRTNLGISTVVRIDRNPAGEADSTDPEIEMSNPPADVDLDETSDSERLLDETMAYYHVDQMARFFEQRYGQTLSRALNTTPAITVSVNDTPALGTDNAMWDYRIDAPASVFTGSEQYNVSIQIGRGLYLRPVHDDFSVFGEAPIDLYAPLDWTRDATVPAHEFTHATIWDVSALRAGKKFRLFGFDAFDPVLGLRTVYHEGMSDYFAGSALDRPIINEWVVDDPTNARDLRTAPDDHILLEVDAGREAHIAGRIFAQSFWELRTRLEQLRDEVPLSKAGARRADRIAWGSVQRVGRSIRSYQEPLEDSLATDSDVYEKLFHYEILAAFARHGIEQEAVVSILQPEHFAIDGRTGTPTLKARGFLGQGSVYVAEFSTDASLFGLLSPITNQQPDRTLPGFNYIRISSLDSGSPPVTRIATSPEGENNIVDFEISSADLELLAAGSTNTIPIFMHLTVVGPGSGLVSSHIEGAGRLFANTDHVGTLYLPATAPGGGPGPCPFGLLLLASPVMASFAARSLAFRSRTRRR